MEQSLTLTGNSTMASLDRTKFIWVVGFSSMAIPSLFSGENSSYPSLSKSNINDGRLSSISSLVSSSILLTLDDVAVAFFVLSLLAYG